MPCVMASMTLIVGTCLNVNGQSDTTMKRGHMREYSSFKDDGSFVAKNIRDNQKEIEMSKMAIEKSDNAQIKALAQQMVDDHTQMLESLQKLQDSVGGHADSVGGHANDMDNMRDSGAMSKPGDTGTASNQLDMAGNKTSQSEDTSSAMKDNDKWNNGDTSMMHEGMRDHDRMGGHAELMNATGKEFNDMWVSHMLHAHNAKLEELKNASQKISNAELKSLVQQAIPKVKSHKDKLQQLNGGSNKYRSGKSGNRRTNTTESNSDTK